MPENRHGRIVETATEARQGEPGPSVRNMLVFGTASVIVLFLIAWLFVYY